MKRISLAFLLCLCCTFVYAQKTFSVKGLVTDTAANQHLRNATISVLNAKDSTLYKFTRAAENGSFHIPQMREGNFILLLTYPEYADYVSPFVLNDATPEMDFKTINMKLKATLLKEVIIKGQAAAIKIKGDTTEFNAGSYTIQPNDKVEDLLKKLPGIQVDKDGKITAQGKTVPKVLVDGAEFFGDDPTLVTKNLRADMVDKVQLFEKKSDQATFTGVDDGEKTQTINIVLKEDKKKGFFGKTEAGLGTDGYYSGQILFNKFKPKEKFAFYGIASNTGKTGLNWDDNSTFGGDGGNVEFIEGGIMISGGDDDEFGFDGSYGGEGIPTARNGGLHYDLKWDKDRKSLNTNYKIGSLRIDGNGNTINLRTLPSGTLGTWSNHTNRNSLLQHKADFTYEVKIDTTSNLKVIVAGSNKDTDTETHYNTVGRRGDESLLNTEERSLSSDGDAQSFKLSALYTKKLKKTGRNFSVNLSQTINNSNTEGFLYSKNEFYDENGLLNQTEITDQLKKNESRNSVFSGNLTYTEPINKKLSVVLNYGLNYNSADADRESYNASAPGRYDLLDLQFSNHFISNQLANQGGAIFSYKNKKSSLNGGLKLNAVNFDQTDKINDINYHRTFINWMPQARYQYRFSQYRSFSLGYNGNTRQPSISQLQPVRVNEDVLNIPIGNPNLKPSYNNNFNANYNSYKVISNASLYLYANFGFTNNQIVNNTTTDFETGKSTYQFINLRDKTPQNFYVHSYISRKIKAININLNIGLGANGNTSYNYINSVINKTSSSSYSFELGLSKYVENKVNFSVGFEPRYNDQYSSLNKSLNNNGFSYNARADFRVYLPGKVELSADARHSYTAKTASFEDSFQQTIINASLSKSFFKTKNLKVLLTGNDLLNENTGFYRFASANTINQSTTNTIRRYFMFSVLWDFNKMGGGVNK